MSSVFNPNTGIVTPAIPWTPFNPPGKTKEPLELSVGDLVMWTGKQSEYSSMQRRVIYQVIDRKDPTDGSRHVQYRFRTAFDLENPIGQPIDDINFMTTREMKKLELIDVGIMRLLFDNFIQEWSKSMGQSDEQPAEDQVSGT